MEDVIKLVLLTLVGAFIVFLLLLSIRDTAMGLVRREFITAPDLGMAFVWSLPTHGEMTWLPRFWHMWTTDQWVAWAYSSEGKAWHR